MADNDVAPAPKQEFEHYVAVWKVAVETQMHFNEMSVKSRQLGLTFVAAALGVAVVLFTRREDFDIPLGGGFVLHAAVILMAGAALAVQVVKTLDLNVYHRMLRGAVTFGEDLEENYMKELLALNKGMTQCISHYSRYSDARKTVENGRYRYHGCNERTAEAKLRQFYRRLTWWLAAAAVGLFIVNNQEVIALLVTSIRIEV